ncbi:hypothetical protein AtNW77_Chr5g0099121 [Arabidopsis thaliana]
MVNINRKHPRPLHQILSLSLSKIPCSRAFLSLSLSLAFVLIHELCTVAISVFSI